MLDQFKKYISQHNLISKEETILVGVSGGIDSTVLCHLLHLSGFRFAIAHCNFKLRGKDADQDELFVKKLADIFSVPIHTTSFETKEYAKKHKLSIQMAARALRFSWFNELTGKYNYTKIAIASNLNDSIETCLINMAKGTGIRGLHGILPKTGNIIHPLVFASRDYILRFASEHNVDYRDDLTNNETKYTRNKVRHNVIPPLKDINPGLENTFSSFFELIKDYETIIDGLIASIKKDCVKEKNNTVEIEFNPILKHPAKKTILYHIIEEYGFNGIQCGQIIESLSNQSGKAFYSENFKLITSHNKLILYKESDDLPISYIDENDTLIKEPIKLLITETEHKIEKLATTACLDKNKLTFPLTLRRWIPGDFFYPVGMKGKKKLSDFFTDNKLSIFEKENTFVITSGNDIVWVVGHRIDDRYKVTDSTNNQFTIRLIKNE